MKFLYHKKAAQIFTIIMVLFSVFVLGGNKLAGLRREAQNSYYTTGETNKVAVQAEIEDIVANAKNLLIISERYLDKGDTIMNNVSQHITALEGKTELNDISLQKNLLVESIFQLEEKLEAMDLTQKDMDYTIEIRANIEAADRKILFSSFNDEAAAFNKKLSNFYTAAVAKVRGVKTLPIFTKTQ